MQTAPIVLFTYNRLEHTKKVIESLKANYLAEQSDLYIFSDGPKGNSEEDRSKVQKLREYLHSVDGFRHVQIYSNEKNLGLARSIISGVTKIVELFGKVIVLEDDLVTSKFFLTFMNDGLNFYKNDDRVISIHGYVYPCSEILPVSFFIKGADCWGWATWKRGWDLFEPDGKKLLDQILTGGIEKEFNFGNSYDYTGMLKMQIDGKVNSWAIRWYASAFLHNKLTLYPGHTLVQNIGFDGSGTHCDSVEGQQDILFQEKVNVQTKVEPSRKAFKSFQKYFIKTNSSFYKSKQTKFEKIKEKLVHFFHDNNQVIT